MSFAFFVSLFLGIPTCTSFKPQFGICKRQLDIKNGQEAATVIIAESYGISPNNRSAPIVIWREGKELDCDEGIGFRGWIRDSKTVWTRDCLLGQYIFVMHTIVVAYHSGDRLSDTALAHEYCHAYFGDNTHTGECDEDRPGNRIAEANRKLKEAGF